MSEKTTIELTVKLNADFVEHLKTQLREGSRRPLSTTEAVMQALQKFAETANCIRLDKPERLELESRSQANTPIRNSRDILRAAERMAGGPNAVTVQIDDGILGLIKDNARDLGFGLADFLNQIVTESYITQFLETCQLHPIYFTAPEWNRLVALTPNGIHSGRELLTFVLQLVPREPPPASEASKTMQLDVKEAAA